MPTPPPGATLPPRFAHAPAPGTRIPSHYAECFGCGDVPGGLRLEATAGEGLTVLARFEVAVAHQGAPGLAHGGLISTAFDEAQGFLIALVGEPAVTGRLETEYRRPVPVGSELHIRAEVAGLAGRKLWTRAAGHLGGPDGPLAVASSGLFILVPLRHFVDHGRPEDVARAVAARRSPPAHQVNP